LPEIGKKTVVVGVGGAGCRVLSDLSKHDLLGGTLVAIDTYWASVRLTDAHRKVELRGASIYGLGSGGNKVWAQSCAEASLDQLREALGNPCFVLIVAGMGGGTGTGASPVIARLAAEAGALVAAVVTLPAQWEGRRRNESAKGGPEALSKEAGAVLVVPLDQIHKETGSKITIAEFYATANRVLCDCVLFLLGRRDSTEFAGLRIKGFQVIQGHKSAACGLQDEFLKFLHRWH
jgi:cell division protein FtsZ